MNFLTCFSLFMWCGCLSPNPRQFSGVSYANNDSGTTLYNTALALSLAAWLTHRLVQYTAWGSEKCANCLKKHAKTQHWIVIEKDWVSKEGSAGISIEGEREAHWAGVEWAEHCCGQHRLAGPRLQQCYGWPLSSVFRSPSMPTGGITVRRLSLGSLTHTPCALPFHMLVARQSS